MTGFLYAPGFSNAAASVQEAVQKSRQRLRETHTLGIPIHVYNELATVWEDCRTPDWDGYDALPVGRDSLRNTLHFLEMLPRDYPAPSVGAEPDGNLTLEWYRAPRKTLSVSVTPEGDLHYAALFGPNRVCGTEAFFDEIPDIILKLIKRV